MNTFKPALALDLKTGVSVGPKFTPTKSAPVFGAAILAQSEQASKRFQRTLARKPKFL